MMDFRDCKSSPGVINNLNPPSVELRIVQLIDGVLDILEASKLNHSLVLAGLVSIGVGHLPSRPHEVLQVLPADPAGEVVHDDPVVSPGGRTVLLQPNRAPSVPLVPAPAPGPSAIAASAPAVLVSPVRSSLRQFAGDSLSQEVGAVQVVHSVVRVTVILKLDEGIPDTGKYQC